MQPLRVHFTILATGTLMGIYFYYIYKKKFRPFIFQLIHSR